jgi:hypothetical protein
MGIHPEFLGGVIDEPDVAIHAEHAKSPAVVRVVEMVGISNTSWSDAAREIAAALRRRFATLPVWRCCEVRR